MRVASATSVGRLRKDARLYDPVPRKNRRGRQGKHGKRLPSLQHLFRGKAVRTTTVYAYRQTRKVRVREFEAYWPSVEGVVKVVAVKGLGQEPVLLFSTDPKLSAEKIIETFAARWKIELGFRDGKGFMGLGESQARQKRAILRHTVFLMIVQSLVQLWYLAKHGDVLLEKPEAWYRQKTSPSFADMLRALRRELGGEIIQQVCTKLVKPRKLASVLIRRLTAVI